MQRSIIIPHNLFDGLISDMKLQVRGRDGSNYTLVKSVLQPKLPARAASWPVTVEERRPQTDQLQSQICPSSATAATLSLSLPDSEAQRHLINIDAVFLINKKAASLVSRETRREFRSAN